MKRTKSNITLTNLAEINSGGIVLTMRKMMNELLRKERTRPPHRAGSSTRTYKNILSVIICTANRGDLVFRAVDSILNQDFPRSLFELIIVNNSASPLMYTELPANTRIINEPVLGLSKARNAGARAAKGEYLLYMDDDAVANEGLLSYIFSAFKNHPNVAIVGGQIHLRLPSPTPDIFLDGKETLWSAYTVPYKSFRIVREQYEFPFGACFSVRHSVLDILGGFPESYGRTGNDFAGGEETALCFMAKRHGFKIGIEPRASVLHCVSPDRFTEEHVRRTIRAGILTTHRLFKDGYAPSGWTREYIVERLNIIEEELLKSRGLASLYKRCEKDAFMELLEEFEEVPL